MLDFNMLDLAEEMVQQLKDDRLATDDAFRTVYFGEQTQVNWYWHVIFELCTAETITPTLLLFAADTIRENPEFRTAAALYLNDHANMFEDDTSATIPAINLFSIIFEVAAEEGWFSAPMRAAYSELVARLYRFIHKNDSHTTGSPYYPFHIPRNMPDTHDLFIEFAVYSIHPTSRGLYVAEYVNSITKNIADLQTRNTQLTAEVDKKRLLLLRDLWLTAVLSPTERQEINDLDPEIIDSLYGHLLAEARTNYLVGLSQRADPTARVLLSRSHIQFSA